MKIEAPPAPSFGSHTPILYAGQRVGATVQVGTDRHVPVCATCRQPLTARATHREAVQALITHWRNRHLKEAA